MPGTVKRKRPRAVAAVLVLASLLVWFIVRPPHRALDASANNLRVPIAPQVVQYPRAQRPTTAAAATACTTLATTPRVALLRDIADDATRRGLLAAATAALFHRAATGTRRAVSPLRTNTEAVLMGPRAGAPANVNLRRTVAQRLQLGRDGRATYLEPTVVLRYSGDAAEGYGPHHDAPSQRSPRVATVVVPLGYDVATHGNASHKNVVQRRRQGLDEQGQQQRLLSSCFLSTSGGSDGTRRSEDVLADGSRLCRCAPHNGGGPARCALPGSTAFPAAAPRALAVRPALGSALVFTLRRCDDDDDDGQGAAATIPDATSDPAAAGLCTAGLRRAAAPAAGACAVDAAAVHAALPPRPGEVRVVAVLRVLAAPWSGD